MRKLITLCILLAPWSLLAQQYNDFEFNFNLDVVIDTTNPSQIWQIGPPQKSLFSQSYSTPNALITDTISDYPVNNYSYCQFRADMSTLWAFPFFLITWQQKTDMELRMDGGWMEVSYDTGQTWVNVFMDTTYQPMIMGGATIDTLGDGTVAFTGTDSIWRNVVICWGAGTGTPTFPLTNVMDVRFVFRSDSVNNPGEGWMIDNLQAYAGVVDFLDERKAVLDFSVYPNPYQSEINLNVNVEESGVLKIDLLDTQGRILRTLCNSIQAQGLKTFRYSIGDELPAFIRCSLGDKVAIQRMVSTK